MAAADDYSQWVEAALADQSTDAVETLMSAGADAIPALAARLAEAEGGARADVIALFRAVARPEGVAALAPLIADSDFDTRVRAGEAILASLSPETRGNQPALDAALLRALQEAPTAAALLLSGDVPEALEPLRAHQEDARLVKLYSHMAPVAARWPALMALSRLGGQEAARRRLEDDMAGADPAELAFLLAAIEWIDSPVLLHALAAATLSNTAETADGVPSGAVPTRTLADVATEAFVRRLQLAPGFVLEPSRRYSADQHARVAALIAQTLPM